MAPSETTVPASSPGAVARRTSTSDPSALTISSPATAAARLRARSPDPCVPVAHAPATEMWPSEAIASRASPASSSGWLRSAYRVAAFTVTVPAPSSSKRRGIAASDTRSPRLSGRSLNV